MENGIVVGDRIFATGEVPVLTWRTTGLQFRVGEGFNTRRHSQIDLMVWHWTGGEGEPPEVVKTLEARKLGVEFAISRKGVIWQFCDPLIVDTADAAGINARSVGCEIVCYGVPSLLTLWRPPKLGRDRQVYEAFIHDYKYQVGMFYPQQLLAAAALADALLAALPAIAQRVPETATARALSPTELKAFTGHVGHYHVSAQKIDPGPALIEYLYDHFRAGAVTERLARNVPPPIPPPPTKGNV